MRSSAAPAGATAERAPLPGDASTRRYVRLDLNGRTAMLMDQPQSGGSAGCPGRCQRPDERRALGYNAVARLAGADCARFVGGVELSAARRA